MTISKTLFTLIPAQEGAYEVAVQFLAEGEGCVSAKKFLFSQGSCAAEESELLDVYSQNGVCSSTILKNLFTERDARGVRKAGQLVKDSALQGPTIIVLDLKDPKEGYKECAQETISKCEDAVCAFFKGQSPSSMASKHAKKIHGSRPDFILCEGQLKLDILKSGGFSASEIDYFHTSTGAVSLCQCAEFFMNAFKMGETAQGAKGALFADKYIVPISGKAFKPCTKSTVLYPSMYKDIYSVQGEFAQAMRPIFTVSGTFDAPSKITTMSVTRL